MNGDKCEAMEWVQDWGHHASCVLPPGHDGDHWDDEGWGW